MYARLDRAGDWLRRGERAPPAADPTLQHESIVERTTARRGGSFPSVQQSRSRGPMRCLQASEKQLGFIMVAYGLHPGSALGMPYGVPRLDDGG